MFKKNDCSDIQNRESRSLKYPKSLAQFGVCLIARIPPIAQIPDRTRSLKYPKSLAQFCKLCPQSRANKKAAKKL